MSVDTPVASATARSVPRGFAGRSGPAWIVALALAVASLGPACAINPASGRRELALIDEPTELQIGRDLDADIVADIGVYADESVGTYVTRVGEELAGGSERPHLPWRFRVLDDPTVNAFALPGGYVYVTRGLLAHLQSKAELAAVLAHEIGHVTSRHSVTQISRAILAERGIGVLRIVDPLNNHIGAAMSRRFDLSLLRHSREHEIESDDLAARYLTRARYDATALIDVLDTLSRLEAAKDGPRLPASHSTHPEPAFRRDRQRGLAVSAHLVAAERDAAGYLERIDTLVHGDDPRQGYVSGDRYVDPATHLSLVLPPEWHSEIRREFIAALSPTGEGLLLLTRTRYASAQEGLVEFIAHPAVGAGAAWTGPVDLHEFVAREFVLSGPSGQLRGVVAFFMHDGAARLLIALAGGSQAPTLLAQATTSMATAHSIDDPQLVDVSPMRIRIVSLDHAMSLREWIPSQPDSIDLASLSLINHVDPDESLLAGARLKTVDRFRAPPVDAIDR